MIELALPAGNLETALTAFKNGADAVYFGLKEFSARKGAVNFSEEDLSKIRRFALENKKKIYITFNTLIDDEHLEEANKLLNLIAFYGCDGLIVQDLGIAKVVKDNYPTLPLHASTQLAVHTTSGVRVLKEMGFERAVLSRELTLTEIKTIRNECPDIELKAFIHGALCYGFSGLCMASYEKCGRSANGGECAQICRTWFTDKQSGKNGYFFSMEDLAAGHILKELDEIGIDSAKIEGRLKGAEYVAALTRYYRDILDNKANREDEERIKTTFARKQGDGYFNYVPNRPSLLSGEYPGHLGLKAGTIISQNSNSITVKATTTLHSHDGLQYFVKDKNNLSVPIKFASTIIDRRGDEYTLKHHSNENLKGKLLYKISSSDQNEKKINTSLPLFKKPTDIKVIVEDEAITLCSLGIKEKYSVEIEEAKSSNELNAIFEKVLRQSGDSRYTLGTLTVENKSSYKYVAFQPSKLKEIRRSFYSLLDSIKLTPPSLPLIEKSKKEEVPIPEDRNLLSKDLPWSLDGVEYKGYQVYTFPPVTFNEKKLFEELEKKTEGKKNVLIGLNNIGQIEFAKQHPSFTYFADIYLYLSNRYAALLLQDVISTGYLWIERKEYKEPWPFKPVIATYTPPLFISRTCYRHDALGLSCNSCSKKEDYAIEQNKDRYIVKVRSCLTVVEKA